MKTRILYTKFWQDPYILSLNPTERLMFVYLLTNQYRGLSDVYEVSDPVIQLETGLNSTQIKKIKKKFQEDRKFIFNRGYVRALNDDKYNNYQGGKNETAKQKELALIDNEILDTLSIPYAYQPHTSINHKSEIINHKSEINNNKSSDNYSVIDNLIQDTQKLEEISESYKVPLDYVEKVLEDMRIWCGSKGKKYKDYNLALQSWIRRDIEEGKAPRRKPPEDLLIRIEDEYFDKHGKMELNDKRYEKFKRKRLKEEGYDFT